MTDHDPDCTCCTDIPEHRLFWLVVAPFSVVLIGAVAMGLILSTDI